MSGKSFDMTRKGVSRQVPVRSSSASKTISKKTPPKPSSPRKGPSLRERRERARNRFGMVLFFLVACAVGAVVYGLWRPEVRVQEVRASDVPDGEMVSGSVKEVLSGTYFGVVPRDSIFFYPEEEIHTSVLDALPSYEFITISRDSFSALSIEGKRRTSAFLWCGDTVIDLSAESTVCFETDEKGFVFAPLSASTTFLYDPSILRVYAPLQNVTEASYPVRATVTGAEHLASVLAFVKAIKEIGIPVLAVRIEGDEAELFVTAKTKLLFVLGEEAEAIKSAEAGLKELNLLNGSIEYVDIRFPGKLYVKRYGEE